MRGGQRSDPHGTVECRSTHGAAGAVADTRDRAAHRPVAQHGQEVPEVRGGGAGVRDAGAREQAGPLCREAGGLAQDGGRQGPQAAPHAQAPARRSGRARLQRLLQPGGGVRPRMAGGAPARGADGGAWHLRAAAVPAGRGVPVRLERGPRDHRRRTDQAAGRPREAVAQPCLSAPCLSAAKPRDAVRCPLAWLARVRWRAGVRDLRQHAHGGGPGGPRQAATDQRPVHGHDQPLRVRADLLQSGVRLGRALERHWSERQGERARSRKGCRMPGRGCGS